MGTLINYLQFILLGAIWGGSFLILRIISSLSPFFVTDLRVLFASILFIAYHLILHKPLKLPNIRPIQCIILAFLTCAAPFTLIAFSESALTASLGAILNATMPIYAALLTIFFFKEKMEILQAFGFFLGIAGVIILVGFQGLHMDHKALIGIIAMLIATFFYACGGLYAGRVFKAAPPITMALWQQFFSFLLLMPFAVFHIPKSMPHTTFLSLLLCLGFICTGLAFFLYFNLIRNMGANKAMTVAYIIPVFGCLWGYIFLHEQLHLSMILGTITIFIGIYLIYKPKIERQIQITQSLNDKNDSLVTTEKSIT